MSKIQAIRKAISLFQNTHVEKHIQRHNQRQWLRSVGILGDNWILARPQPLVQRQTRRAA